MTGVLLIDKPSGITSHDVVARMRRVLQERSIGHTGTLDPMATGLLVLVVGKATRLASLLSGGDKTYDATVRLGVATTTDDAEGEAIGDIAADLPDDDAVRAALDMFRGTFSQLPPPYSAKKVDGVRAYRLVRQDKPVNLSPVDVTVRELAWLGRDGADVSVRVQATAGFYVRALARDIGARLGCGAHLASLRRTRSGSFDVNDAWRLDEAEAAGPATTAERLISPADALPDLAAAEVTQAGLARVLHGNSLDQDHLVGIPPVQDASPLPVRLLSDGRLVALARWRAGALHPVVVLG